MYIVQEIQNFSDQTLLLPPLVYTDWQQAEGAYHSKLGSAAISNVPLHVVAMFDEYCNLIKNEWYEHNSAEE